MRERQSRRAAVAIRACIGMLKSFRTLFTIDVRPYRPEKFYMRGPGPKWHDKHGRDRASLPG